jgi:hypothetical protein
VVSTQSTTRYQDRLFFFFFFLKKQWIIYFNEIGLINLRLTKKESRLMGDILECALVPWSKGRRQQ